MQIIESKYKKPVLCNVISHSWENRPKIELKNHVYGVKRTQKYINNKINQHVSKFV